jgi:alkyldihydroxyacetonephosphate synthase
MSDVVEQLRHELGEAAVLVGAEARAEHARDWWMLSELEDLEGHPPAAVIAVAEPADTREVAAVLRTARATRTPVVPYGGGSGVCGGVHVDEPAIVLSTRRLDGLVSLEERNLLATFRAGTNGMAAERRVQQEGLTIGHWPQSIELSTVGGWVATRAAGQYSTGYGSIEDLLFGLEAVLPDGSVVRTRSTPRASAGPDLRQLFLGSEGTLGVVTEVTFSLRPKPPASRGSAFSFGDFGAGLEAIRVLMREGWRPPVVRLYDAAESARSFGAHCPEGRALMLLLHEGTEDAVVAESSACDTRDREAGGQTAPPQAVADWLDHRNNVPGFRSFLEKGIVVDTIEVGATWDRVLPLYERVTRSLREVDGILIASGHSSHSYRSGTNLYFTFLARPEDRTRMAEVYLECWRRTMEATIASGGGISHHHGIGRVRRGSLEAEIGASGVALLRAVKRALDPDDLLNPGTLLPDL